MPERQRRGTPEHDQYEELCALAAGGLLEGREFVDFQVHMKECGKCRAEFEELSSLVTQELTRVPGRFRQRLETMRAKPLPYSRQRFLRRARAEGMTFSREAETRICSVPWYFRRHVGIGCGLGRGCGRPYGLPFPRDAGHNAGEGRCGNTANH